MTRLPQSMVVATLVFLHAVAHAAPPAFKPLHAVGPTDAVRSATATFSVTPVGEAIWTMPLWVPEGRNGIQPHLAVSYRSRADSGVLGLRFTLDGFASITRCWQTIRQDGGHTPPGNGGLPDKFCVDGQGLVPRPNAPASDLQPEFDPSVLVRMVGTAPAPQGFVLYRSDARIEYYGFRPQTPFLDSSHSTLTAPAVVVSAPTDANGRFTTDLFTESLSATPTVLAWNLARVQDHHGNYYDVDYRYENLPGPFVPVEQVPYEIRWTGFAPTTPGVAPALPSRRIVFGYRPLSKLDARAGYQAGVPVTRSRLLEKIQVFAVDGLVSDPNVPVPGSPAHVKAERLFREYRFDYMAAAAGQRSRDRLRSITECVANTATSFQCLDPVTFRWSQAPSIPQFEAAYPLADVADIQIDRGGSVPAFAADVYDMVVGDFDGDGRDDVVYRLPNLSNGRFRDVNGEDPYATANPTDPDNPLNRPAANTLGRGDWFLRRGTPTGLDRRTALTGLPPTPGGDWKFSPRVVDVDGDGTAELVLYSEPLSPTLTTPKGYQAFRLGCAGATCDFAPIAGLQEPTEFPLLRGYPRRSFALQTGDLNGDGLVDFVHENASALQSGGDPTTLAFRAGATPNGTTLLPKVTLRAPNPVPPSNGNIGARLFDERFVVDTDGNGQPELLTLVDDAAPAGSARPFTFSTLSPVSGATGGQTIAQATTLHAADVEASDAIGALIGRAACYPPGDPALHGMATDPQTGQTYQAYTRLARYFLDVNGDGLRDSVAVASQGSDHCPARTTLPTKLFLSFNTGAAFRKPIAIPFNVRAGFNPTLVEVAGAQRSMDSGVRIADLDGDGREDFLLVSLSQFQTRVPADVTNRTGGVIWLHSSGASFVPEELGVPLSWNSFGYGAAPLGTYGARLAQVGDFNGDGLLDFIMPRPNEQRLSVSLQKASTPDFVTGIDGGPLVPAREITYARASVTAPYLYSRDATRCSWPQTCLKTLGWVVASTTEEATDFDAAKPVRTVFAFRYENARSDFFGRGLLGVDKLVKAVRDESAPPNVFRTETEQFDLVTTVCQNAGQNRCAYVNAHRPSVRRLETPIKANRRFVSESRTSRSLAAIVGGAGYRVTGDVETHAAWEEDPRAPGTRTMLRATRDTRTFDAYGNRLSRTFETSGNELPPDGSTAPAQIVYRTEETMPLPQAPDEAVWLVARYPAVKIKSVDPTLPAPERELSQERGFTYVPGSAEIESVTIEPARALDETPTTSGFTLTTTIGRDERGSVTSIVQQGSGKQRQVGFAFDANDLDRIFPVESTDNLNHTTKTYSHAALGVPEAVDDPNGIRTEFDYDALGRLWTYRPPGVAATSSLYRRAGRNWRTCDTGVAFGATCESYDPAHRLVKWEDTGETRLVYDRFGRLVKWSLPFDPSGARPVAFVGLDRDGLGRVTALRRPGETPQALPYASSTAYDGLRVTRTSERSVVTIDDFDAKGRLVHRVRREPATATTPSRDVESTFEYGHFDLPRRLRHPVLPASQAMTPASAALVTTFGYDVLGRLTTIDDADAGGVLRAYDAFNDLKRFEDATGSATTYEYDDVGRLRLVETAATAAYPSRIGNGYAQRSQRFYDGVPNGIGRLDRLVSNDGVETRFEYDTAGRPSATTWTAAGASHRFSFDYNALGQLEYLNYPSTGTRPFRLRYGYLDDVVSDVTDVSDPAHERPLWHQIARNAADQSTEEQFGRTAHVKRVYDDAQQLRFVWGEFISSGEMFQQLAYKWEGDGFVRSRTDLVPDMASRETYTHDFLDRLGLWNVQQNCSTTEWKYTYDDLGNLRRRAEQLRGTLPDTTFDYTTALDAATPHAVKRASTGGAVDQFDYTGAGQVRSGRGNTYTWTPFGLPWRIANTAFGSDETLLHDGTGSRIVRQLQTSPNGVAQSLQTVTIDGLYEVRTFGDPPRSEVVYNVPATDGIVAQVRRASNPDSESVQFVHSDHLGNPEAITGETVDAQGRPVGTIVERAKYEPFGERRFPWALAYPMRQPHAQGASLGFTGHEPDDAFGLVNMRGRVYDPASTRFLSPDPWFGGPHPEARNRYSYVRNSPVVLTDPSGFIVEPEDVPVAAESASDPDEWISWQEANHPPQETVVWGCASCSPPPLVSASDESSGEITPGAVWDVAVTGVKAVNDEANAKFYAIAHGATGATLQTGGEFSLALGIGRHIDPADDEEDFEMTMLEWRVAGLEYEEFWVDLGRELGDQLATYGLGGEPELPPGTEVLYAKNGVNLPKVKRSTRVGMEAHRQILRYKFPAWIHEQMLELIPGLFVRKDALRLRKGGAEVLIIKPNTPTGRLAGARRGRLMKAAGYDVKFEYYDPTDPAFKPGSPTYIGPTP